MGAVRAHFSCFGRKGVIALAIPYSRYIIGSLPWYSVLMVSAILIAYLLGTREEKRLGLPQDSMLDMVLVAIPSGIVGARLYFVLMSLDQFIANPISTLYIWEGGIAIYGSLLGGALGVWIMCRVRNRSFASLMDITAPGLALAQAIGRWGNYFNREAYGPVIHNVNWQFFPAGVLIAEGNAQVWHVATFFYESMWNLAVFVTLWLIRKHVHKRGDLFLWYMVLYGSGRYLVEQLRTDSLYMFGFRASQYLSLLLILAVAAVFMARLIRVSKGSPRAWTGALLCVVLAFLRPLAAQQLWSVILTFVVYTLCCISLFTDPAMPRFAKIWLIADAAVYLALQVFGVAGWWQSPYFLYAGLSIPPYLAVPYLRQARAAKQKTAQGGIVCP